MKTKEFGEHIASLTTLKSEHDARLAARPEKPDGYALEFPKDFKPEVPITFKPEDARVPLLRQFAHEQNWDQATFSKALAIDAAHVIAEHKAVEAARAAEAKKLGPNATAVIEAHKAWLGSIVGKEAAQQVMDRLVLASDVEIIGKLQAAFSTQGGAPFNGKGRETPNPPPKSLEQRLYPNTPAQQKAS